MFLIKTLKYQMTKMTKNDKNLNILKTKRAFEVK